VSDGSQQPTGACDWAAGPAQPQANGAGGGHLDLAWGKRAEEVPARGQATSDDLPAASRLFPVMLSMDPCLISELVLHASRKGCLASTPQLSRKRIPQSQDSAGGTDHPIHPQRPSPRPSTTLQPPLHPSPHRQTPPLLAAQRFRCFGSTVAAPWVTGKMHLRNHPSSHLIRRPRNDPGQNTGANVFPVRVAVRMNYSSYLLLMACLPSPPPMYAKRQAALATPLPPPPPSRPYLSVRAR
jgi:hypothetical protein